MQSNKNVLFIAINVNKSINFARLTLLSPLTRTQTRYLILLFTFKTETILTPYLRQYGICAPLAAGYWRPLIQHGYLIKIRRGEYKLTDKARRLHAAFLSRFNDLQAAPFTWR